MKGVEVNTMSKHIPEIVEISPQETQKILEQDPEKAKIELEIKKFNRESEVLKIQHQPSNLGEKIVKSPWFKLLLAVLSSTTALLVAAGTILVSFQ